MTITKLGFKCYSIVDMKGPEWCAQLVWKQYMYYTKKEAIQMFKEYYKNYQIL